MFEKLFGKSEKASESNEAKDLRGPLVPNFIEDPAMEGIVKEYIEIWRLRFACLHDGEKDEAKVAGDKLMALESKFGTVMREYLQPYIDRVGEQISELDVALSEHDRWQTANVLKNLHHDSGDG